MARKKGSIRRSGRTVKRNLAPPNAVRQNEIVEEVADNLRPWKSRKSFHAVTAAINHQLEVLVKLAPLLQKVFNAGQYRRHAKKLDKALRNVEELLKSTPAMLALSLFEPLPPLVSIEGIELEIQARIGGFCAELERLRKICTRKIGTHQNYDYAKHLSARFAYGLMEELSDGKITGTAYQPLRNITSLLYEAVSGQQDADLKRACDEIIHQKET